ncbi:tripartite motif-containing protein 60-like [Myotis lucifugus]|uniref:tripartite motif-containing protein 60-like n=1 Tax=Myotis lucifugus TaxID=59463 RepID=UPI0003C4C675|nr:tripartite motif-containing protein 60-like [Myotis lucifugus]
MAFAASLAKLQAEASCPICLDYLRDPVTTECGHNFCSSCIHQRWEGLQDTFPCPVCLHHCRDRSLMKNIQLYHMTETVKQIPSMRGKRKRQEEPLCKKHREVLTLFCEKDLELLCAQCRVSSDHQDQPLIPIEEAAASHRGMLKRNIEAKASHLENVEMLYKNEVENTWEVKRKIEKWREELDNECKEIKCFLAIQQNEIDNNLLIEEKDVEEKLIENGRQISYHRFRLSSLLSKIEEKCLQTDEGLLTGIESIHNGYGNQETPAVLSCDLRTETYNLPPHYLGLHKMFRMFQACLTLDPETAHPNFIMSRDKRSVTYRTPNGFPNPQDLTSYPAVLSSEGFDAGRHFWAVEVTGTEQPKIGIFLDYELGEVSFYNLNNRSYLHGITDTFTEKLMPYFSIASSSASLIIYIV